VGTKSWQTIRGMTRLDGRTPNAFETRSRGDHNENRVQI
jgi:hypothetical protein